MKESIYNFRAILFVASSLMVFLSDAEGQNICLSQITSEQGLPGSNINDLYQDQIGYLWFGIEAVGLCKYDGKQFKLYDNTPYDQNSLSNNFVWDIASFDNNLWIATENGLNYYYREKDLFFQFFTETFDITDNRSNCLLFDSFGNLWVGANNGLNIINASEIRNLNRLIKSGQPVNRDNFKIRNFFFNDSISRKYGKIQVLHLLQDSNNHLWISTNNGIFILNLATGNLEHLMQNAGNLAGLPNDFVHFVSEYGEGEFLIGTNRGLCKYMVKEGRFTLETFPEIKELKFEYKGYSCYLKDSEGIEWIGMSEGLLVIDHKARKQNRFTYIPENNYGLTSKVIRDIIEDRSGQIWIATKFGGVHVFKKHQDVFQSFTIENVVNKTNHVEDNFVLSLLADRDDNIWVGTKYGGLLKFDYTGNTYESFWIDLESEYPGNSNRIECIYEDSKNNIWIGTPKGLNKLNKQSGKFTFYPFYMTNTILEDSRGTLWIGTMNGIYILNRKTGAFETYPTQENISFFTDNSLKITCLFEDSRNNLWFGTYKNGLFVYQPNKNYMKHYVSEHGNTSTLSSNLIRAIYEVGDSAIWIGTKHSGLNLFCPETGGFGHLSKTNGLPSNAIYSILSDHNGRIWIGTHNGLSAYDSKTETFQNFHAGHGLQSNIFENTAKAKTRDGFLLFGGHHGFNMFHPDSIKIRTFQSPLVIKTIKVNERPPLVDLNKDTVIYLKHFQNYIDIEFTLLDFRNPSANTYSYVLEGVDKKPVEAGSRNFASYTDMKPGTYQFKLVGMGQGNYGESNTLNIRFVISPAYWETNLAYLIYAILTLGLLIGIYKIATIRANYINRLNESQKAIQQNMELNETKLRFFTNISHELQTPLALISIPAESLCKSKNLDQEEKQFVELIQNNIYKLTHLVRQLLYFRKTQNEVMKLIAMKGDIIGFLKEITQPFMVFAQKHHISFKLTYTEEVIVMRFDPDKMEKIISNLLMNAFKFTSQGGRVEIHVSSGEYNILGRNSKIKRKKEEVQLVKISVLDTGIGMSKNELKNIFTRFYTGKNNGEFIGTGIGLELTKTLVEMHGGAIEAESKEGEGSKFTISLFRGEKHLKRSNISDEEIIFKKYVSEFDYSKLLVDTFKDEGPVKSDSNLPDKPLLLIVEDNNDLRKFLGENLAGHYNVLLAENGKKGLSMATDKIPDLIISDVMMPEMDGVEMCKRIKSDVLTSHIPVILLTHKTLIKDKIDGLKTGADDYVEKPFNMQYLLLRINNIFQSIQKVRRQIIKELGVGKVESSGISVYDNKLLNKCKEAVNHNLSNPEFSVEELGKMVGMSRSQLYRKITALTGQSPTDFIYTARLQEAKRLLVEEKYSVMDVAHLTGFSSSNSFSQVFKKNFGISPKDYAEKYTA